SRSARPARSRLRSSASPRRRAPSGQFANKARRGYRARPPIYAELRIMFRFIHSSDLHIGKRFGNFPEDLRGRLREARLGALVRLAQQARAHGAGTVLLAGDTFDTETPTPQMLHHAMP